MSLNYESQIIKDVFYENIPIDEIYAENVKVYQREIDSITISGSDENGNLTYSDANGNIVGTHKISTLTSQTQLNKIAVVYGGGYLHLMINDDSNSKGTSLKINNSWNGNCIVRVTGHSNVRYLAQTGSHSQLYACDNAYLNADISGSGFYIWGSPQSIVRAHGNAHIDLHFGSDVNFTVNNPILRVYENATAIVTIEDQAYVKTNGTTFMAYGNATFKLNMNGSANIGGTVGVELQANVKSEIVMNGNSQISATSAIAFYNNGSLTMNDTSHLTVMDTYGNSTAQITMNGTSYANKFTAQGSSTPTLILNDNAYILNASQGVTQTGVLSMNTANLTFSMNGESELRSLIESSGGTVIATMNDSSKIISNNKGHAIYLNGSGTINLTQNGTSAISAASPSGINGVIRCDVGQANIIMNDDSTMTAKGTGGGWNNAFLCGYNTKGNVKLTMNNNSQVNIEKITNQTSNCGALGFGGNFVLELNDSSRFYLARTQAEQTALAATVCTYSSLSTATITDNRTATDNIIYYQQSGGAITYTGSFGKKI